MPSPSWLENKVILLTGGKRMGLEISEYLEPFNVKLAVVYRESKEEAGKIGWPVYADMLIPEDINLAVQAVKKEFRRIDGLIHLASPYKEVAWDDTTPADWKFHMDSIARSAFCIVRRVVTEMADNKDWSKIILCSDWSPFRRPYPGFTLYNTAKGAVEAFVKSAAVELAPRGILVNCIAPGPIIRPENLTSFEEQEVLSRTPLGRWGGAEEIAKGVRYLFDADFVTGTTLIIDGGRSIA